MITAIESFNKVKAQVESIVNDSPQSLANMEPLDEWRQGDVRIIRLPDNFEEGLLTRRDKVNLQVAPGSTVGSRHTLDSDEGVTEYSLKDANALDGPVMKFTLSRSLLHPEHGDCVDMPPGWYAFPGQRSFAEELRRVLD